VCAQVTLTKTGLSAVRTFSPLGVKLSFSQDHNSKIFKIHHMVIYLFLQNSFFQKDGDLPK
jgi:hypothetical protein